MGSKFIICGRMNLQPLDIDKMMDSLPSDGEKEHRPAYERRRQRSTFFASGDREDRLLKSGGEDKGLSFHEWEHRTGTLRPSSSLYLVRKGRGR